MERHQDEQRTSELNSLTHDVLSRRLVGSGTTPRPGQLLLRSGRLTHNLTCAAASVVGTTSGDSSEDLCEPDLRLE